MRECGGIRDQLGLDEFEKHSPEDGKMGILGSKLNAFVEDQTHKVMALLQEVEIVQTVRTTKNTEKRKILKIFPSKSPLSFTISPTSDENDAQALRPGSSKIPKTRQPRDASLDRDPNNYSKDMIIMYEVIRNLDFVLPKICQLDYEIRNESTFHLQLCQSFTVSYCETQTVFLLRLIKM